MGRSETVFVFPQWLEMGTLRWFQGWEAWAPTLGNPQLLNMRTLGPKAAHEF
jgi:hypothetical protein